MLEINFFQIYYTIFWGCIFLFLFYNYQKKKDKIRNYPPSPLSLPIVGHLYLLARYATEPWIGFNEIKKKYGDIVKLQLGEYNFVLLSSIKSIKEVLLIKSQQFMDRPHFERYEYVFGGDRDNALALCDWSKLQKLRRSMAKSSVIPKYGSKLFNELDDCIAKELGLFTDWIEKNNFKKITKLDTLVSVNNIFFDYLCSLRFDYEDKENREIMNKYDIIFWDINKCYAYDFIPWLTKFGIIKRKLIDIKAVCDSVRDYIEKVILPRHEKLKNDEEKLKLEPLENCQDFLEFTLRTHYSDPINFNWMTTLYLLGDLLGGNSAVANLLYRVLGYLALNPDCQQRIYEEAKAVLKEFPNEDNIIKLNLKSKMVYTESCVLETLRLISSPLVPHVATQDTTIGDYFVKKNTCIMFNCYNFNCSEEYHLEPNTYEPTRFLIPKDKPEDFDLTEKKFYVRSNQQIEYNSYQVFRPNYFFPFSWGKRACLGFKMAQTISFCTIANLVLNYSIEPDDDYEKMKKQVTLKGCLALEVENIYDLKITKRE
nr:cytochrome p450 307A2 [Polyphagotarsonemus latus]